MVRTATILIATICLAVTGCTTMPDPVSKETRAKQIEEVYASIAEQEPVNGPITLEDAIARALLYNLDSRIKAIEEDIASVRHAGSIWQLLPKVTASGSVTARSNTLATSSESILTGQESLESSTSQEDTIVQSQLRFSWNILDFGVSYFAARQQGNQVLIARQRRSKVLHELVQDVRQAYWQAVAGERLIDDVEDILAQVQAAAAKADEIRGRGLRDPLQILQYKRTLYANIIELQNLRRQLRTSKLELARQMNLPPSQPFELAKQPENPILPGIDVEVPRLEETALMQRPELLEASYTRRIAADETRKAMARMLPGLELSASTNFNSNDFLLNNYWNQLGSKITWNLLNVFAGRNQVDVARRQTDLSEMKYQAVAMSILAQVNISLLEYKNMRSTYRTTESLYDVDAKILENRQNSATSRTLGNLDLIRVKLRSILSKLKKDQTFAQAQGALGRLLLSVGYGAYDELPSSRNLEDIRAYVEEAEALLAAPTIPLLPSAHDSQIEAQDHADQGDA